MNHEMRGFGFRLRRSGGKTLRSWVVQYKRAAATRRVTLGPAEVLGAEAARVAAKKLLAKVALGEDPQAERELDPLEDGRWRFPAARSKNGRAHTWPLENDIRAALATWHDHLRILVEGGEHKLLNFQPQAAS